MSPYKNHITRNKRGMSHTAEILLDMVAICGRKHPTFIELKSAASLDNVCSTPTAQIELHWLIDHNYLVANVNNEDRREKRLHVTSKGERHLAEVRK